MVDEPGRITLGSAGMAGDQQETAPPLCIGQRHQQPAVLRRQRVEPSGRKMRHAGIDDDRISRPVGAEGEAVCRDHRRLRPG